MILYIFLPDQFIQVTSWLVLANILKDLFLSKDPCQSISCGIHVKAHIL